MKSCLPDNKHNFLWTTTLAGILLMLPGANWPDREIFVQFRQSADPPEKWKAAVTFNVDLKAGKTRLQTWLIDQQTGKSRGAYYVYVKLKR